MTSAPIEPSPTYPSWRADAGLYRIDLSTIDVLTIDVFDTAVFRRCGSPLDLLDRVEATARAEGALTDALPAQAFSSLRARAERAARDAVEAGLGHREVTLAEIYARFPSSCGCPARLAELEIAAERANLLANPAIVDLIRAARASGVRVCLVSDTYHPGAVLTDLLDGAGLPPDTYDRLFASCDHGASKDSGTLFGLLRAELGVDLERWLHVGDNPEGDVRVPSAFGLRTLHYASPPALERIERREALVGRRATGAPSFARRLAARGLGEDGELGAWFDLGRLVIGPPIHAFCATVARSCHERGVRRIAPFLREGALFAELIAAHARHRGWSLDVRPLAVSREALFLPSLPDRPDRTILGTLARSNNQRTVRDALRLLGLEDTMPAGLADLAPRPLADLAAVSPGAVARVAEVIEAPASRQRIAARLREARQAAVAYLNREFGEAHEIATVDLGARGSTQAMIGRIPGIGDTRRFHHHLLYGVPALLAHLGDGHLWFPFAGLDRPALDRAATVYRSPHLIELALIGDLATTVGYRPDGGGAVPVTLAAAGDAGQAARLAAVQRGIRHAARVADAVDETLPPEQALDILYRLIAAPTAEEARLAERLHYDVNDGLRHAIGLADEGARTAARAFETVHPASRPMLAALTRPGVCPWPQAALTLDDPDTLIRLYEATSPGLGHDAYIRLLLEHLRGLGLSRVTLCAAGGRGGMGPAFRTRAVEAGIAVTGYFDHFDPDGTDAPFDDLPAWPLAKLDQAPCTDFAIVSAGYAEPLARSIAAVLEPSGRVFRLLMLPIHGA